MKIQVASDLHIERYHPRVPPITKFITPKAPILILAGDIGHVEHWEQYSAFIVNVCHVFKKVILIAGNHEYYTTDPNLTISEIDHKLYGLKELVPNLVFLQNQLYLLRKGIVVFGTTFWSEIPSRSEMGLPIYSSPNVKINSTYYNLLHFQAKAQLEKEIRKSKMKYNLIVVTHHAPTFKGTLAPKYRFNRKNCLYCSHCDDLIEKVSIWIYGHTGYNNSKGRLVSNQIQSGGKKEYIIST